MSSALLFGNLGATRHTKVSVPRAETVKDRHRAVYGKNIAIG